MTTSNYGDQVCNFFTPTMLRYVNKRLTRSLFLARSMATFEKNKDDASWRSSYNKATRQHYDVFLSHAGKDKCTVTANLYEALVGRGLRTFFDKADLSREYAGEQNSGGGQDRDRGPLRREQKVPAEEVDAARTRHLPRTRKKEPCPCPSGVLLQQRVQRLRRERVRGPARVGAHEAQHQFNNIPDYNGVQKFDGDSTLCLQRTSPTTFQGISRS